MKTFSTKCRKSLITLACVIAAIALVAVPQNVSAKKKKIGIQLYSVMDAMNKNPQKSIERLAAMGYNSAELVQWGGDPKVFGMPAEEFKKLCDANSMKIVSTHSSIQEDKNKEEEIMNRWRELFKIQKACGGKYFVIPSYGVDYTVQGLQDMCNYFNKVGKIAQEYGLTLGYHNHSNEFQKLKDSDDVMWEYLVEHTDPQYVCFELDVYWCAKGGKDPVEYLKKYPKRIQLLHIKDDFVIGEGTVVNFENVFNQFYKNKMKDFFVEIEIPQSLREKTNADGSKYNNDQIMEEMFKAAEKSMQYLKNAKFVK